MNRALLAVAAAVSMMVAGCAVEGASYEKAALQPKDQVIYVYRPYSYFGSDRAAIMLSWCRRARFYAASKPKPPTRSRFPRTRASITSAKKSDGAR
jgi:hypothetical protein